MARILMVAPGEALLKTLPASPLLEGHEIEVAAGDSDAIRRLRQRAADVLITSPDTDLDEDAAVLDEVRAARPGVRIVILAPHATPVQVIAALRERVFACFSAPFDPDQVVEVPAVRTARTMVFYLQDPGPGFDAAALAHAAVGRPDDPLGMTRARAERGLRPGGFGLLITRQVVDEVIHNERGNEVILIKHLA
jgi:ActR/RegA family two-component response regulator